MIAGVLLIVLFCFLSVVCHELGHILMFRHYTKKFPELSLKFKKLRIVIGNQEEYKLLTQTEYEGVVAAGVFAGFIPLVFSTGMFTWIGTLAVFSYYSCGMVSDFRTLIKAVRRKDKEAKQEIQQKTLLDGEFKQDGKPRMERQNQQRDPEY